MQQLQHAVALKPDPLRLGDFPSRDVFIDCCFGLVVIGKSISIVRLVHLSVNEFLQCHDDFLDSEEQMALSCPSYISLIPGEASKEGFKASSIAIGPRDSEDAVGEGPGNCLELLTQWPLLQYAASYWGVHASAATSPRRDWLYSIRELATMILLVTWGLLLIYTQTASTTRFTVR